MNTLLKKSLLFIVVLIVFSCSKNDDSNDVSNENIRLKTHGINADEYNFTYNSDNQLTSYQNGSGNADIIYNAENKIIQIGINSYTYNALGRLSEIDERSNHADLIYNTQGLLATMNFTYLPGSTSTPEAVTRTFKYDTNNRLIEIEEKGSSDLFKTRELLIYDSNDNVVQIKNQISHDLINYTEHSVEAYTYDNKENPNKLLLKKMGINNTITLYFLSPYNSIVLGNYVFFRALYFSNNNILSSTRTFTSGIVTTAYTYTYNADNYPNASERTITNSSSGVTQTTYYTWLYETIN